MVGQAGRPRHQVSPRHDKVAFRAQTMSARLGFPVHYRDQLEEGDELEERDLCR